MKLSINSAVESGLQRTYNLDGATLQVTRYEPLKSIPMYPNRVLILNLNPDTTKDGIINYLEAKTGDEVTDVAFGQEEGTVLVTFEELTGLFWVFLLVVAHLFFGGIIQMQILNCSINCITMVFVH